MIELNLKYYSLFKLSVNHTFYSQESRSGLNIVPANESQQIAKRLGLILKRSGKDYYTLFDAEKIEGLIHELNKVHQPLKFTFFLFSSDPYFINITDIPLEDGLSMFYFSNNNSRYSEEVNLLHENSSVSKSERYKVVSTIKLSGTEKENLIEIKDGFGNTLIKRMISAGDNFILSNQNLPVGKYELWENDQLKDTFILYTNPPGIKPIGIIDVFISGKFKDELLNGIASFDIPSFRFEITFSSRKTFWKYFLIGKYNLNLNNVLIETQENKYSFKGPSEISLKSGQKAVIFESETSIPLKQIYDFGFQLKSSKNEISNGKIIMDNLPLASPDMIKPESRENDSKIFSEIIVHI